MKWYSATHEARPSSEAGVRKLPSRQPRRKTPDPRMCGRREPKIRFCSFENSGLDTIIILREPRFETASPIARGMSVITS